jgi:hypothetical protein
MVNNFTVCQNPYNDFSWWHKNIFTSTFLLLYFLLPLRMGPTCHRDTHQVFTYLILSLHPPAPSFLTHKPLHPPAPSLPTLKRWKTTKKWMEEWGPCVVRGPVDGRFLLWWVIDNVVWTDSWLSIAGAGSGLTRFGAGEEQARKVVAGEASKCGEDK